ncbi:transcription factor Adf-1 [Drosophila grimshawi]|uniref:GH15369 n=1 Tax=Drosophila grimshawi TaxID=7222 RepID=B4J3F9_DROGR|nr:transcription factor Adf-1 [Drosophila grimshawi]EDV90437.1 GH22582 [Drosophila grimshawi]EDV96161.1 GH15369 [Drosophila grimshawi]
MRTSYKKNRPFDFKLIDHVEPNTVLYKRQTGLSNYDVMKVKTEIWSKIAEIMECDVKFCLMRWNNLHYQFRKESRRPGGSTWPYFERLRFLKEVQTRQKTRLKAENQTADEVPKESFVDQDELQSFNDCVVMHVTDEMEQHADSTLIIEEIIEQTNDQILHEEIIYEEDAEVDEVEHDEEEHLPVTIEPTAKERVAPPHSELSKLLASPASDYQKMGKILGQLKGQQKELAERRILAFVLKCQLRALVDEPIDDLVI